MRKLGSVAEVGRPPWDGLPLAESGDEPATLSEVNQDPVGVDLGGAEVVDWLPGEQDQLVTGGDRTWGHGPPVLDPNLTQVVEELIGEKVLERLP